MDVKAQIEEKELEEVMSRARIDYYHFPDTVVTVCCAVLENGFTLVGVASAITPDEFDEEEGRKTAYEEARDQLWPLLGYNLKENLSAQHFVTPGYPPHQKARAN